MNVGRLVAYLCVATWIGSLWHGASDLMLEGSWRWLIPTALSAGACLALALLIRRDRRAGRLS